MTNSDLQINKTNILPLRWFANMCGSIAGWAILRISYQDELEDFGWRYKLHSFVWKITWPVYYKFGTFYAWTDDLGGAGWDDYDENGHPYWDFLEWHEDPLTGDAWRLKYKNGEEYGIK